MQNAIPEQWNTVTEKILLIQVNAKTAERAQILRFRYQHTD